MLLKTVVQSVGALALLVCPAVAIDIETVPVGDAGNSPDTRYDSQGFGAVDYEYNIGKYEITAGQYCEFLNAAAKSDPYELYSTHMLDGDGCKIYQSGLEGNYSYTVSSSLANRPVNDVSWYDATMFANWMTSGDIHLGAYDTSVESGWGDHDANNYTGITAHASTAMNDLVAAYGTVWVIPTEDEWYKAAYYDPTLNDGAGGYYDYPTSSNNTPSNRIANPDPGNNANFSWATGSMLPTTPVGLFGNSESPYGTFDQGGNVWEWNEAVVGTYRGRRGGSCSPWEEADKLHASYRNSYAPHGDSNYVALRLVSLPGPTPPVLGDLDGDGIVASHDLDIVRLWWLYEVEPGDLIRGDATGDGLVNSADLDVVRGHWGAGIATVPEPGVVLLVLVGCALVACRRR